MMRRLLPILLGACAPSPEEPSLPSPPDEDPCLEVALSELDVGETEPGGTATGTVEVRNGCGGALDLFEVRLTDQTPSEAFDLDPLERPVLYEDQSVDLTLRFAPVTGGEHRAELFLRTSDPERDLLWIPVVGVSTAPRLEFVAPRAFDTEVGCASTSVLRLENHGSTPLVVSGLDLAGADAERFTLDTGPKSVPLTLEPDTEGSRPTAVDVSITHRPLEAGVTAATLLIRSDDPETPELPVALDAVGHSDAPVIDRVTVGQPKADVLFTLDRSGSMREKHPALFRGLGALADALRAHEGDPRVAIAVDDSGCIVGSEPFVDGSFSATAARAAFETMADVDFALSSYGSNTERGFMLAEAALQDKNLQPGGCNATFLREDASLSIAFISDERPAGGGGPSYYVDLFRGLEESPEKVRLHAIAGDVPDGCPTAAPAPDYHQAAMRTGGTFHSICDTDLGPAFEAILDASFVPQTRFELTRVPVPETLVVRVDETVTEGWSLDEDDARIVTLDPPPGPGATVELTYLPQPACSD